MSEFDPEVFKWKMRTGRIVYWRHEVSGRMASIVGKFLNDEPMDPYELKVIRWYVWQFVDAMPSKPDDCKRILEMSKEELKRYNWEVLVTKYAIDPF